MGNPPPTPGSFCILGFKISDLHTFGEFDDVLPVRKELEGRVWEYPPPTPGSFCIL